jgi:putative restriction endonuclease
VTVTPDLTVEVSPQIQAQYFNGKAYYRLHGAEAERGAGACGDAAGSGAAAVAQREKFVG